MKRKVLALFILISLISLPVVSGDDFTLDIDVDVSKDVVEQGASFNVLVDAEGQYVGENPYEMDKQVLVEETVFLNGAKIGEGNIPIGAEGFVFTPGQTMSLDDTIPCRVPEDTPPGNYTLEVKFYAAAFGSSISKTRYAQIQVIEAEVDEEVINPPEIYLSMFPVEMSYGSTTNLTIRVYNPNNADLETNVILKKVKKVGEYFLEDIGVEIGPFETFEVRRSFSLQQRLTDLCFLAEIQGYVLDREQYTPQTPIMQQVCATILQRPSLVPNVSFGDFVQDGENFSASAYIQVSNSNDWADSVLPREVIVEILGPQGIEPLSKTLNYYSLNHDISARYTISGPIEYGSDASATMTITVKYPEQYALEDEVLSINFNFPTVSKIKDELGIEDNGDNGNDNDNGGENTLNPLLQAFLDNMGGTEGLSNEEIEQLLGGFVDWQREIFS